MKRTSKELKRMSRQMLLGNYGLVALAFFLCQAIVGLLTAPFENQLSAYNQTFVFESYGQQIVDTNIASNGSTNYPIFALIAVIIISLLAIILSAGNTKIHMDLARKQKTGIGVLFSQFRCRPDRFIISTVLVALITILCILPGIVCLFISALLEALPKYNSFLGLWIAGGLLTAVGIFFTFFFALRFSLVYYYLIDDTSLGALGAMKESFRTMKGHCGRKLYILLSFIPMELLILLSFGIAIFWVQPYVCMTDVNFYLDVTGELTRKEEEARRLDEEMGPLMTDEYFKKE
ncbi:MAG: DUF975 family protein [Lachnospiraceae bacterium]|jgi:uncharacterized membrane protein|nr:DUF975 family protein [Lachnospiraceae bacterium]